MQLTYEFDCPQFKIDVTDPNAPGVDPKKPLILLLHGLGGDKDNMSSKVALKIGSEQGNRDHRAPLPGDQDLGWWWLPPGWPIDHYDLDPLIIPVLGWKEFLEGQGFRTALYSQVDSWGLLAKPVDELAAVFSTLDANLPAKTKIVILAHSRGGLLARKFIKEAVLNMKFGPALSTAVTARLTKVITLHSPHSGTALANLANSINTTITALEGGVFGGIVKDALDWLRALTASPAYQELAVGSLFLTDLASGETGLPGVKYHTFGGTSVTLTRLRAWVYTLASYIPQWRGWGWPPQPPFDHVIMCTLVPISPVVDGVPFISGLTPELTPGVGDVLVADAQARLWFAVHHTNALNHAEAQWGATNPGEPDIQAQVLPLL